MKVCRIELGEDEMPVKVVVELSTEEAAFIARAIGKHTETTGDAIMPGGGDLVLEVYNGLTGAFFNRFWDGGVGDV